MKDATIITLWICTLLVILECVAIAFQVDGAYFMPVLMVVAGLGGYEVKRYRVGV